MDQVYADLWISNLDFELNKKFGFKAKENAVEGVALWMEDKEYVYLPRGYRPPTRRCVMWADVRPETESVQYPPFRRRLREKQEAPATALLDGGRDKLLCLGCGKGKSTIALWYAKQRDAKTLIIVDRDFLVEQWIKEIKACYWFLRESIGRVQADENSVGKHFTLATIQTLGQREQTEDFYNQFRLVVVDEAQLLGAPVASQVLPRFPGERLLLSATPTRRDGMHPVFMYHAGGMEPIYTDLSRDQSTNWYLLMLPKLLDDATESRCYRRLPGMTKKVRTRFGTRTQPVYAINRPVYDTEVVKSLRFNQLIVDEVMKAARSGRNCLVLGSRVEQLEMLASVVGEHFPTGCVTGKVKGNERLDEFKKQVLFVTDKIGSRALDVPRLDTLFMLFPNQDADFIRQTVGRIDREMAGKNKPVAVVFCHPMLEKTTDKMVDAILEVDPIANMRRLRR